MRKLGGQRRDSKATSPAGPRVRAVVGTAGHVDHGKTTLTRHLTGIDTDRLGEEKARGISIELGFAWLDLPEDGGRVALVDVPGHERFVRQMIAGAAGIDLVALVIAADEGVMPQTREHLDICELLGVKAGMIVVSKCDLVDDEWLELVVEDLAETVKGTFLEGAPIVRYSAGDEDAKGRVVDQLAQLLDTEAEAIAAADGRPFKLSVDRAFTIKGFGTVVTGTSMSGAVSVGEPVEVLPSGLSAKVRGIETHGNATESVGAGERVALNLTGIEHTAIRRGDVVSTNKALVATSMIDVTFRALAHLDKPVADRTKGLLHIGTSQVEATLGLIGREVVAPGESVPAQLRLAHPVAFLPGEPFVLRGFAVLAGYGKTLGGGRAWVAQERRHRRGDADAATMIETIASGDVARACLAWITFAGEAGRDAVRLELELPFPPASIRDAIAKLTTAGDALRAGSRVASVAALRFVERDAIAQLTAFHTERPAARGPTIEELRTRSRASLPAETFAALVNHWQRTGLVAVDRDRIAKAGFEAHRTSAQERTMAATLAALEAGGLSPPRVVDLPEHLSLSADDVDEALGFLLDDGQALKVSRELVFARSHIVELHRQLVARISEDGPIDTATFKELTGVSRKWTIPLGEYFDRQKITVRVGERRQLRADAPRP